MKSVVITGSTKGIGLGMAEDFLARGCQVMVSGRKSETVNQVVGELEAKFQGKVFGHACDVSDVEQVEALWNAAVEKLGRIDIWINNAGQAQAMQDFWTLPPEQIQSVVQTNVVGTMYGTKVAISGFLEQGGGALYNMEGAGATGRMHTQMLLYASTKRGLNYLNQGLVKELEGSSVLFGMLRPGMVVTDLLMNQRDRSPEDWERTKKIFNILADKVENVTPVLVERILANEKHGAVIDYTSQAKMMWRFMSAPFSKRDLFADEE